MSTSFFNTVKGNTVLYLFFLANSIYLFMVLYTIPQTSAFANGMSILDLKPLGYDLNYVNQLFGQLGDAGRLYYHKTQLAVDFIYPLLFIVCYTALAIYTTGRLKTPYKLFKWLYWLPLVAGLSDYAENLFIHHMLNTYPKIDPTTVTLSSIASVIKSSTTTIYFILIITAGIMVIGQKYLWSKKTASV
ncbi:MAG: hypothetical protein ACPHXS_03040 [Flavobacteriaceae bacterium]